MFCAAIAYFCEKCSNWKNTESKKKCDNADLYVIEKRENSDYAMSGCRNYKEEQK